MSRVAGEGEAYDVFLKMIFHLEAFIMGPWTPFRNQMPRPSQKHARTFVLAADVAKKNLPFVFRCTHSKFDEQIAAMMGL